MTNAKDVPRFTGEEIEAYLQAMNRTPFRGILARLIGAEPSVEALEIFAEKSPDRWAQAIAILGRMSGFHDKLLVEGSPDLERRSLSDAEILQRLADLDQKLGNTAVLVGEGKGEELPAPRGEDST